MDETSSALPYRPQASTSQRRRATLDDNVSVHSPLPFFFVHLLPLEKSVASNLYISSYVSKRKQTAHACALSSGPSVLITVLNNHVIPLYVFRKTN
jgi:hypothetical protein